MDSLTIVLDGIGGNIRIGVFKVAIDPKICVIPNGVILNRRRRMFDFDSSTAVLYGAVSNRCQRGSIKIDAIASVFDDAVV
jgi:hypothetical protein